MNKLAVLICILCLAGAVSLAQTQQAVASGPVNGRYKPPTAATSPMFR